MSRPHRLQARSFTAHALRGGKNGTGDALSNELNGSLGNDHIEGRDGDDVLLGDVGTDFLDGGAGIDRLNGGGDTDECLNGETVLSCEE